MYQKNDIEIDEMLIPHIGIKRVLRFPFSLTPNAITCLIIGGKEEAEQMIKDLREAIETLDK